MSKSIIDIIRDIYKSSIEDTPVCKPICFPYTTRIPEIQYYEHSIQFRSTANDAASGSGMPHHN